MRCRSLLVVSAALALLFAAVALAGEGDPLAQPEPFAQLSSPPASVCVAGDAANDPCRSQGSLPANRQERELFALWNSVRTDPAYWRSFAFDNAPNILERYGPVHPLHYWYSLAAAANYQANSMKQYSPSSCVIPTFLNGGLTADCYNDSVPLGGTCKPNEANNSTYTYCCFRIEDCKDSSIDHGERLVHFGFLWNDPRFVDNNALHSGYSGGQAGFINSNSAGAYDTVKSQLCDDWDQDGSCNRDCANDNINDCNNADPPEAPAREQMLGRYDDVGGAGYAACSDCQYNTYWAFSQGFYANPAYTSTFPIASASYVTLGADSGYMLTYYDASLSAFPSKVKVVIDGAAFDMPHLDQGQTFFYSHPASSCETYAFLVHARGQAYRYPESGYYQTAGCTGSDFVVVDPEACYLAVPTCRGNGICWSATQCVCANPDPANAGACVSSAALLTVGTALLIAIVASLLF